MRLQLQRAAHSCCTEKFHEVSRVNTLCKMLSSSIRWLALTRKFTLIQGHLHSFSKYFLFSCPDSRNVFVAVLIFIVTYSYLSRNDVFKRALKLSHGPLADFGFEPMQLRSSGSVVIKHRTK